jgi:hypothetical protein
VKRTRCTTCDAEHEYKQAKLPRQRKKADAPAALYSQVLAGARKRTVAEHSEDLSPLAVSPDDEATSHSDVQGNEIVSEPAPAEQPAEQLAESGTADERMEEGPIHRRLIRATLPRVEGQPAPARPAPEFTIRQPAGRPGRFRPRHQRQAFQGNRSNGNTTGGFHGSGMPRHNAGRPPYGSANSRQVRRHDSGRKRSK